MTDRELFDPMIYDVMLEMATRIGGRYIWLARVAATSEEELTWREKYRVMRKKVRAVDAYNLEEIEAMKSELREIWKELEAASLAAAV